MAIRQTGELPKPTEFSPDVTVSPAEKVKQGRQRPDFVAAADNREKKLKSGILTKGWNLLKKGGEYLKIAVFASPEIVKYYGGEAVDAGKAGVKKGAQEVAGVARGIAVGTKEGAQAFIASEKQGLQELGGEVVGAAKGAQHLAERGADFAVKKGIEIGEGAQAAGKDMLAQGRADLEMFAKDGRAVAEAAWNGITAGVDRTRNWFNESSSAIKRLFNEKKINFLNTGERAMMWNEQRKLNALNKRIEALQQQAALKEESIIKIAERAVDRAARKFPEGADFGPIAVEAQS
ncbi:MAG TPA: hypothetical protein VEA59_05765 [Patescibacteria group bacterium]|nr:hypothetical protein [Patescibacteria group bacterium]